MQKEMRHSEVKSFYLVTVLFSPLNSIKFTVSWYYMFLSFFMSVQISFDSSRDCAMCNHVKPHICVCPFLEFVLHTCDCIQPFLYMFLICKKAYSHFGKTISCICSKLYFHRSLKQNQSFLNGNIFSKIYELQCKNV